MTDVLRTVSTTSRRRLARLVQPLAARPSRFGTLGAHRLMLRVGRLYSDGVRLWDSGQKHYRL